MVATIVLKLCILHMKNVDMDTLDFVAIDEQTITKVHLEILWRQNMAWKLHYHISPTWAFLR